MPEEHFKQTCHFLGYQPPHPGPKKEEEQEEERKKERKPWKIFKKRFWNSKNTAILFIYSSVLSSVLLLLSFVRFCLTSVILVFLSQCLFRKTVVYETYVRNLNSKERIKNLGSWRWNLELQMNIDGAFRLKDAKQQSGGRGEGGSDVCNCAPCHQIRNWGKWGAS